MRARDLVVAGVCVPLLVLGGCSDAEPETTPVVSDSPSVSDAPTPTETGEPTPATVSREDEARELVSDWVAALNEAGRTGDVTELQSLSSDKCVQCFGIMLFIQRTYEAGGEIRGRGWDLLETVLVEREDKRIKFVLEVRSHPQTLIESVDAKPTRLPGGTSDKTFWVGRLSGELLMLELDQ